MKITIHAITTLCVTAAFAGCMAIASAGNESAEKKSAAMPSFAGYHSWHLVNPKPYFMPDRTAVVCAWPPTPEEAASRDGPPHADKYIQVYVNDIAAPAMMSKKPKTFAPGSTIVKEKRTKPGGPVELLTVMVKGAARSSPRTGDWKYYVTDSTGGKVTEAVYTQASVMAVGVTCQYCHNTRKKDDYVFRSYLQPSPQETAQK